MESKGLKMKKKEGQRKINLKKIKEGRRNNQIRKGENPMLRRP